MVKGGHTKTQLIISTKPREQPDVSPCTLGGHAHPDTRYGRPGRLRSIGSKSKPMVKHCQMIPGGHMRTGLGVFATKTRLCDTTT